eukprot:5499555-Amphidinium_carterae.2
MVLSFRAPRMASKITCKIDQNPLKRSRSQGGGGGACNMGDQCIMRDHNDGMKDLRMTSCMTCPMKAWMYRAHSALASRVSAGCVQESARFSPRCHAQVRSAYKNLHARNSSQGTYLKLT